MSGKAPKGQQFMDLDVIGITGVTADGSATGAGAAHADEPKTSSHKFEDGPITHEYFKHFSWPILNIEVNKSEIASRVADRRDGKTAPEALWADELDSSIKKSLTDASREQLLKYGNFCKTMTALQLVNIVEGVVDVCIDPTQIPSIVFGTTLSIAALLIPITQLEILLNAANMQKHGVSLQGMSPLAIAKRALRDKRWSMFPTYQQPDRFLLAKAALSSGSVVRYDHKL